MSKKCYKMRDQRIICGVCAGVAEYFNIDILLVRIVWAAFAFGAIGIPLYIIAAIFLPEA